MPYSSLRCRYVWHILWRLPLTLVLTLGLYGLGIQFLPYSGDGSYMADLAAEGWVVTTHSPLTSVVHRMVYLLLNPFGVEQWHALAVSSAFAGALAIQVLYAIQSHPLFMLINIASGSFLVFVGEVENYAWVNLFLLLTYFAVEKYTTNQWRLWPALTFFFTAALLHGLALFYLPPLFWLMYQKKDFNILEFFVPFFYYISGYFILNLFLEPRGIYMDITRLVPFFELNRKGQHFTFFTLEHLMIKSHFHQVASFLGIPLEWPLLILLRKRINTLFRKYLLFCVLIGLLWHTAWHPDLGRLDWDLFSHIYIPLHVLLGLIVTEHLQKNQVFIKK